MGIGSWILPLLCRNFRTQIQGYFVCKYCKQRFVCIHKIVVKVKGWGVWDNYCYGNIWLEKVYIKDPSFSLSTSCGWDNFLWPILEQCWLMESAQGGSCLVLSSGTRFMIRYQKCVQETYTKEVISNSHSLGKAFNNQEGTHNRHCR